MCLKGNNLWGCPLIGALDSNWPLCYYQHSPW